MYFVGFSISALIVPRLGDKYGRRKPYLISMSATLFFYLLMFMSTNVYFTILCYFLIGLASAGRMVIGTNYLNEFIP